MKKNRDDFPPRIRTALRDRADSRCSNPGCRVPTKGPSPSSPEALIYIGKAAHICAAASGGPRFDPGQSPKDRSSIDNAIHLCARCADLIDSNGGIDYPANLLRTWKRAVEAEANSRFFMSGAELRSTWKQQFSMLHFVNIPRIAMLAASENLCLDEGLINLPGWLHDLGFETGRVAGALQGLLQRLTIAAVPLDSLRFLTENLVGCTISFNQKFRTRNGVDVPLRGRRVLKISADLDKAPHIYAQDDYKRIVLIYDPKWLTTSTSFCELRPPSGANNFAGLCIVKSVDECRRTIFASPVVFGMPKPAFDLFELLGTPIDRLPRRLKITDDTI